MLFKQFCQINLRIIYLFKSSLIFYQILYYLVLSDKLHKELYILVQKKSLIQLKGQVQMKTDLKINLINAKKRMIFKLRKLLV